LVSAEATVRIFGLRNKVLEKVLSINEQEAAMEQPSGNICEQSAQIISSRGRITTITTRSPWKRRTCAVYTWNESRFRFEQDPAASRCPG